MMIDGFYFSFLGTGGQTIPKSETFTTSLDHHPRARLMIIIIFQFIIYEIEY
jgi:hypothetical protein